MFIIAATHAAANGSLVHRLGGGERAPDGDLQDSHPLAAHVDRLRAAVSDADVAALARRERAAAAAHTRVLAASEAPPVPCADTPGWRSKYNAEWTCDTFRSHFCSGDVIRTGEGPRFGSPEKHCCGCGLPHEARHEARHENPQELPSPTDYSTALAAGEGNVSSWRAAVDRAGKVPGWIAPVGRHAWLTFEFELSAIVSQVAVEYLTTYKNIGATYCRLNGGELVRLNALVPDSHTSHERQAALSTAARRGRQQLSCLSDGRKFKITRIVCTPPQTCDGASKKT